MISGKASLKVLIGVSCLLGFSAVSSADTAATFTLGSNPNQTYMGIPVGPYPGGLSDSSVTEFMCLDLSLGSLWGETYAGTTSTPNTPAEDEAAFLSAYLLQQGAPSSDQTFVNNFEGPISFAIWQIMGTLGSTPPDPAAAFFVNLAENAYNNNQITTAFLSNFLVFTPNDDTVQRFLGGVPQSPVPEPGTLALFGGGLLAALVGGRWWQRKPAHRSRP